jgi:hypothetical protein
VLLTNQGTLACPRRAVADRRQFALRAVTEFFEVVRGSLDEANLDQSSREAILDFLRAMSDESAKLMRKLRTQH